LAVGIPAQMLAAAFRVTGPLTPFWTAGAWFSARPGGDDDSCS
jgi:hypothetical protein